MAKWLKCCTKNFYSSRESWRTSHASMVGRFFHVKLTHGPFKRHRVQVLALAHCCHAKSSSLVPRPSHHSVFDHFQFLHTGSDQKLDGRKPGNGASLWSHSVNVDSQRGARVMSLSTTVKTILPNKRKGYRAHICST